MENLTKDFRKFALSNTNARASVLDDQIKKTNNILTPYILEERQLNVATFDVFSRLMYDRIIYFTGVVDDDSCNTAVAQLLYLSSVDERDISMYINSPGGSVVDGLGLVDTMNYINCDISTTCIGMAASMGAFLLSSGTKGKRISLPNSEIMIHQPLGGAQGQATEIEIHAREILRIRQEMNEVLAKHTGQSVEKIAADTERDHYLTSKEAKEYGLIDEVVSRSKSAE